MIFSVAWRNLWRSKTRSLVVMISICAGLAAGIFYVAFYNGMVDQRIDTAIKTEASHIQVHYPDYLNNPDKKYLIEDAGSVTKKILALDGVKSVTQRVILNSMIQSPTTGAGVKITGINPDEERNVTNLYSKLIEGSYFEDGKRNPIVIGKKLAEKLKVKLRSKVVVTLQDMQGNITGAAFRVEGIFETSNTSFDESCVFVKKDDLARVMLLNDNSCHEIAVLLNDNKLLDPVADLMTKELPDLDVKTWRKIMPEVDLVESSLDFTTYIIIIIILFALLFGIINTMLMAVLERAKELGMLMAIGMNRIRVFTMILLETVLLSLTGGICGIVLGWILNLYFAKAGISLSAWSDAYRSMGFDTLIFTRLSISTSLEIAVMIVITGIIASIYPAIKALRLRPAEAIRIDM
ncbi:MAG: ABC transporter permease [Prolixibacteraceae bacterium]|nr:ABC transporter permease [Prolixibacteraceae bacterium]MBN2773235.1 ABC transporter permease [Prolixibacteraceae bacterium]